MAVAGGLAVIAVRRVLDRGSVIRVSRIRRVKRLKA